MNRRNLVQTLFIGLFVLAVAPVGAAPAAIADAPTCSPVSTTAPASPDGLLQPAIATSDGIGAASDCTADCWDGSSVTCGGSTCSAQDSNCSVGVQGYCEDGSGTTFCPACQCYASTLCPGGGPANAIDCSGETYCNEASGCWVHCDGVTTWCPGVDRQTCPAVH